jgi:hypothetical protein
MWKVWASLVFSLLLCLMLIGGMFGIGCRLDYLRATLGGAFPFMACVYPFALAFSIIGFILQYCKLFADRGTPSRPLMSRSRALLPVYGVVIFILIANLSVKYFCH